MSGGVRGQMRVPRVLLPSLAAVLALCAATLALNDAPARYTVVGVPHMPNLDFRGGKAFWFGRTGGLRVHAGPLVQAELPSKGAYQMVFALRPVPEPGRYPAVRVSADLRAVQLGGAAEPWQGGHLLVLSFGGRGRLWHWPGAVGAVHGDGGWQHVAKVIPVAGTVRAMELVVYVVAPPGGALWVRDLRVAGVAQTGLFRVLRYLAVAAWLAAAGWVVATIMRCGRRSPARVLAVLLGLALITAGLIPQPELDDGLKFALFRAQDAVLDLRAMLSPPPARTPVSAARRPVPVGRTGAPEAARQKGGEAGRARVQPAAPSRVTTPVPVRHYWEPHTRHPDRYEHLTGFTALGLLVALAWGDGPLLGAVLAMLVLGAAIESLQSFTITRTAEWSDLGFDLIGIATGVALAHAGAYAARALARLRAA